MRFQSLFFAAFCCVSLSGAAVAQQATKPSAPRPLVFSGKEKTRAHAACERAVGFNLNGKATTGDVRQACVCVTRVYDGAEGSIPAEFLKYFWAEYRGVEVINPAGIRTLSDAELVPGKVKITADVLAWDVRTCLGALPTRGQLTGSWPHEWRDQPDTRFEYGGRITTPVQGPASPVDLDLGGLLFVNLQNLRSAVEDFTTFRSNEPMEQKYGARDAEVNFLRKFGDDAESYTVLACAYRTQAQNGYNRWMSTKAHYFWYQPDMSAKVVELVKALPAESVMRQIAPPRDTCPLREPAS